MFNPFPVEIFLLIILLVFSIWLYNTYFVNDVNVAKFNQLDLDSNCRQYLSTIKTRQSFQYILMIASMSTLILGTLLILLQASGLVLMGAAGFYIFCIVVFLTVFCISYKIFNCLTSRIICGGGDCFYST